MLLLLSVNLLAQSVSISGIIRKLNNNQPVAGIRVMQYPSGTAAPVTATSVPSGSNGVYMSSSAGVTGSQYRVLRPFMSSNYRNGVTTFDSWSIDRHILGIAPLGILQQVAGDVNGSESLTSADVVAVRQLILAITNNFGPNSNNAPSWLAFFSGLSLTIPNTAYYYQNSVGHIDSGYGLDFIPTPNASFTFDFTVLKLGDVNFSASNSARVAFTNSGVTSLQNSSDRSSKALINNSLSDVNECDIVTFNVSLNEINNIVAWQQALSINSKEWEFVSVTGLADDSYHFKAEEQTLYALNYNPFGSIEDNKCFSLKLKAKVAGANPSNAFFTDDSNIENTAFTFEGDNLNDAFSYEVQSDVERSDCNSDEDIRIYPNPINAESNVIVYSAEEGEGILSINDLTGRNIATQTVQLSNGRNDLKINNLHDLEAGVFVVHVALPNGKTHFQKVFKN